MDYNLYLSKIPYRQIVIIKIGYYGLSTIGAINITLLKQKRRNYLKYSTFIHF